MTLLPAPLHRPYRLETGEFNPQSVEDLAIWYPINGKIFSDSAFLTPAGTGDPVGARQDHAGYGRHAIQATTSKKPTLDAVGPGVKYDAVDDLMVTTYVLNPASKFAAMMALWAKDGSDAIKTIALGALKPNLDGEYAPRFESGVVYTATMPGSFTPDAWTMVGAFVPEFAHSDGLFHTIFRIDRDSSNSILFTKVAVGSSLDLRVRAGGTDFTASLTKAFAPGDFVWFVATLAGGTLTLYVDTDADNQIDDNSSVVGSVASLGAGTWTFNPGQGGTGNTPTAGALGLDGALSLQITTGTLASALYRYNAGAARALAGFGSWLDWYADKLVLSLGGSASAVELKTFNALWAPTSLSSLRLHLSASKMAASLSLVAPTVSDGFNRANEALGATNAPTGQAWTTAGTLSLAGGVVRTSASNSRGEIEAGTANHRVSALVNSNDLATRVYRICARMSGGGVATFLSLRRDTTGVVLTKHVTGTETDLVTGGTAGTNSVPDRLEMRLTGASVECYLNGTLVFTHTLTGGDQTTFASQTKVGVFKAQASDAATSYLDDFMCCPYATSAWALMDQVTDWSGNAFHFTQVTPKRPMLLHTGAQWVFRGDGVDDLEVRASIDVSSATLGYFMTATPKYPVQAANAIVFASADEASGTRYWEFFLSTTGLVGMAQRSNDTDDTLNGNTVMAAHTPHIVEWASSGTATSAWVDGAAQTLSVASGANNGDWLGDTANRDNFSFLALKRNSEGNHCSPGITDLVLTDVVPTSDEQSKLRKYSNLHGALGIALADVPLYTLSSVTPTSTVTGVPSRVIWAATKSGSNLPLVFVGVNGSEQLEIGYRNDAGSFVEAAAAGSLSVGVHSVSLEFDGTTLRGYVDNALAVSLAVSGTFTGLDTLTLGGLKTFLESHAFDERQGEFALHTGRVYSAIERKRLHNYLASVTTGLAVV